MLRTLGVLFASAMFATAAHATVTTIEYTGSDGNSATIAYDDSTNTATVVGGEGDGQAAPYTYDEASNTICGSDNEGKEVCVSFEKPGENVGDSSPYSTNDGRSGTATIVSVE